MSEHPAPSRLNARTKLMLAEGISINAFTEYTTDLRALAQLDTDFPARIPFVDSIKKDKNRTIRPPFGYFVSTTDFMAFQSKSETPRRITRAFDARGMGEEARAFLSGEPSVLRDEDFAVAVTLRSRFQRPPAAMVCVSPKLSEDMCRTDYTAEANTIRAHQNALPKVYWPNITDHVTYVEKSGWYGHPKYKHDELTDAPARVAARHTQHDQVVWSLDRRVLALPPERALDLRSLLYNGHSNHTRDFTVEQLAMHGGKIIEGVNNGDYFARIKNVRNQNGPVSPQDKRLFTLVPGYLAAYIDFADSAGSIESVHTQTKDLDYQFDLAAHVNIAYDMQSASIDIAETTEPSKSGGRPTALPTFEAMICKNAFNKVGASFIRIQGRSFRIAREAFSPPAGYNSYYFAQATRFSTSLTPKGHPFHTEITLGPDPRMADFMLSQVPRIKVSLSHREYDFEAL